MLNTCFTKNNIPKVWRQSIIIAILKPGKDAWIPKSYRLKMMSHLSSIINIILRIVNPCFSSGDFPASCKSAFISPLIKKTGLDSEILKNYRPVANLSFISKIIEKAIATQIHSHLIIHALISCRLDYCNSIMYNVPKSKTDRLQRLQNQCAPILTKSPRREHITPVLMKLHWLKIQDRIIYKMLMLTYKSYYNMAPPYLCELIILLLSTCIFSL